MCTSAEAARVVRVAARRATGLYSTGEPSPLARSRDCLPPFATASQPTFARADTHTHASTPAHSIEKGRRGVVKLVVRLLCIEGLSVAAGRALLIPAAIMHKAQRIEAKVNKKDTKPLRGLYRW